jgi:hypothetical protein
LAGEWGGVAERYQKIARTSHKAHLSQRGVDNMRMSGKVLASAVALALAGVMSMGVAQAIPAAGKVAVSSQLDLIAAKKAAAKKPAAKKTAAKKPAAKKAAKKGGPGTCGVMKYWDKKTKKCADATTKKV